MCETQSATVIIIEDNTELRQSLEALAAAADYRWRSYVSAESLLADNLPAPPCCLWVDLHLPGMSGLELQTHLARRGRAPPFLMMSADDSETNVNRALESGALEFLSKPFDPERLLRSTGTALTMDRRVPTDRSS